MSDLFIQIGLSNACFSLALAIVAMVVGAKAKRPHLAHLLWLLVFVKLLTPPIVTIPIVTIPQQAETVVAINDHSRSGPPLANSREFDVDAQPAASLLSRLVSAAWNHVRVWLPPIWLLGSVVVFAWSMVRVCRFSRLLAAKSEVAPQELQTAAVKIARRLELNTIPTICTTSARLSPLVWWAGGKVQIVIPTALLDKMDAHEWQWILAHELAHVRRRDYLVRWLEWLACVCFWWNPVVWWARYNLRANEEICCDALVVSSLKPRPLTYANSLLTAVEYLACPALRPPAMASEINSGGFLERRFKMIVSETPKRSNTRWLRACVLLCAMVVLPLGIASAQDYEAVGRRLRAAVQAGELTGEQARAMLGVLKKEAGRKKADIDAIGRKIRVAVQAGKLTKEEGRAKMDAVRKGGDKKEIDINTIGRRIRAAVQAGKLTKEEGRAKMAAIKKGGDKKKDGGDKAREYLMKVRKELGAAVEAGKISREDAAKRYEAVEKAIRERMAAGRGDRGSRRISREDYARAEAKMRKMVEEGKAKPEDVERRLIEMRKMMAEQGERKSGRERAVRKDVDWESIQKRIYREDFANAADKIRKAIAEGKMSEEEGRDKFAGMRKMIRERSERAARKDVDWEGIKKRIEGAVKSGKMTEEQGKERLAGLRKRMATRGRETNARGRDTNARDPRAIYAAAEKRIKAAIASGRITEEQGKERLAGLRKRMAGSARRTRGRDPKAVYDAAEKEIKAAIAAGRITEAQGKTRLEGLKKRLAQEAREAWIRENLGNRTEQGARGERTRGESTRGERTRGR